jgi:hypothetical protein
MNTGLRMIYGFLALKYFLVKGLTRAPYLVIETFLTVFLNASLLFIRGDPVEVRISLHDRTAA